MPVMRELSELSLESVTFYVRSGNVRTCLYRIEAKHPIRYMIREGDVLPLLAGSGGRVLAAFQAKRANPTRRFAGPVATYPTASVIPKQPEFLRQFSDRARLCSVH